jgi:S1/P1 Nuclease
MPKAILSRFALFCTLLFGLLHPLPVRAWGYQGHEVVGAVADRLLKPNASNQVRAILNGPPEPADPNAPVKLAPKLELKLQQAGPWADCVKSVVRHDNGKFRYEVDPNNLEYEIPCVVFSSPEERARMEDYARRNWDTCTYPPEGAQRGCHNTFHFDDVAIQSDSFDHHHLGTNNHDLVTAIGAAIAVLSGKPIPPPFPFGIRDKREALLLLVHLIGDLHQPLHVGSVYLDAEGRLVDPDRANWIDPATDTTGGNAIQDQNLNLHAEWDAIPYDIGESATRELTMEAQATPPTTGPMDGWPVAWATESLHVAQLAFRDLKFQPNTTSANYKWTVVFDDHVTYLRLMDEIKRKQLAKGGAHLAEILNALWP